MNKLNIQNLHKYENKGEISYTNRLCHVLGCLVTIRSNVQYEVCNVFAFRMFDLKIIMFHCALESYEDS